MRLLNILVLAMLVFGMFHLVIRHPMFWMIIALTLALTRTRDTRSAPGLPATGGLMHSKPTVAVVASYAPSLLIFREHLLKELRTRGYRVVACAPADASVSVALGRMGIDFRPVPLARAAAP